MQNETTRTRTAALAASALLAAAATGCTHNDSADPNAAPYGAAASPSAAASAPAVMASAPVVATTAAPAAPPIVSSHADPSSAPGAGAGGGPMTGGPMMGAMGGSPTDPLTPTPDLDAKIATAEKSGKKPDIAAAYAERGTFREFDEKAGARVKYRAALQDFRKALAADPTNAEAKKNKDEIEGIYKQMGRPIPE